MPRGRYEETRLKRLLDDFDGSIARNYIKNVLQVREHAEKTGGFRNLFWLEDKTGMHFAFRFISDVPLFLMLSHPISRFAKEEKYWLGRDERRLCLRLGIIPAFLVTLDTYSIVRLWGGRASDFFSPTAEPIPQRQQIFWEMTPGSRGPQWSSMNFVLAFDADLRPAPPRVREILEGYFTYMFWEFPQRGFTSCAHILNDSRHIQTILKAAKSIYAPKEVYNDTLLIGPNEMDIQRIVLWGLQRHGSSFKLSQVKAVLTKDVAKVLQPYQKNVDFFINGVVSEFRRRTIRFDTLTVVARIGFPYLELLKSVIGLVVSEHFKDGDSLSYVGSNGEVETEVNRIVKLLSKKVIVSHAIADGIKDQFDYALSSLFPLIILDGDDVMFFHPLVLSSLFKFPRLFDRITKNKERLINALRLLEKIPNATEEELSQSKEAEYLQKQGIMKELVIRGLQSAVNNLQLLKVIKKCFKNRAKASNSMLEKQRFPSSS